MQTTVPVGYRFTPTEEELISVYLKNKILGLPLPCDIIRDKDMYGDEDDKNPWNVFNEEDTWEISVVEGNYDSSSGNRMKKKISTIYVFARLKKVNENSKNDMRKAGCGTWVESTGTKEVYDIYGQQFIGFSNMLCFEARKEVKIADSSHWLMHEYWLEQSSIATPGNDSVICKVTRIDEISCQEGPSGVNRTVVLPQESILNPSAKRKSECKREEKEEEKQSSEPAAYLPGLVNDGSSMEGDLIRKDENLSPECFLIRILDDLVLNFH